MPLRLLQSSVIFGLIGLALTLLGLAALGILRDPFASRPRLRIVVLAALVGGFLVGRPFPLFERLFHWAVGEGNPLAGAAVFTLQSLGNITFVALLYVMVVLATRGGILRWLVAKPSRLAAISGCCWSGWEFSPSCTGICGSRQCSATGGSRACPTPDERAQPSRPEVHPVSSRNPALMVRSLNEVASTRPVNPTPRVPNRSTRERQSAACATSYA